MLTTAALGSIVLSAIILLFCCVLCILNRMSLRALSMLGGALLFACLLAACALRDAFLILLLAGTITVWTVLFIAFRIVLHRTQRLDAARTHHENTTEK